MKSRSICIAVALLSGSAVWATPLYQISGQYRTRAVVSAPGQDFDTGLVSFTGNPTFTVPDTSFSASGTYNFSVGLASATHISGSGDFGSFHALADASASVTQAGAATNFSDQAGAFADVEFQLLDTITPTSASLANGTAVSFLLTGTLEGTMSAFGLTNGNSCSVVHAGFGGTFGGINVDSCTTSGAFTRTVSSVVTMHVGQGFTINTDFFAAVGTIGAGSSNVLAEGGTVNVLNTGSLTIESLTPGVTFTSASGGTYQAAAVPEPSTGGLVLFSLTASMFWKARYRDFHFGRHLR